MIASILRTLAQIFSWIFHPLLILTYMLIFLLVVNPYPFGVPEWKDRLPLIAEVFANTFLIPAFALIMFRLVGFAKSMEMKTTQERIGPYIASGVLYLWLFVNLQHHPNVPSPYKSFVLGATISLFMAFFINNFSKISAHAVGMGGLLGMILIAIENYYGGSFTLAPAGWFEWRLDMLDALLLVILAAGIVGSSRLLLRAHEPMEVYGGYLVGFGGQLLALQFVYMFA